MDSRGVPASYAFGHYLGVVEAREDEQKRHVEASVFLMNPQYADAVVSRVFGYVLPASVAFSIDGHEPLVMLAWDAVVFVAKHRDGDTIRAAFYAITGPFAALVDRERRDTMAASVVVDARDGWLENEDDVVDMFLMSASEVRKNMKEYEKIEGEVKRLVTVGERFVVSTVNVVVTEWRNVSTLSMNRMGTILLPATMLYRGPLAIAHSNRTRVEYIAITRRVEDLVWFGGITRGEMFMGFVAPCGMSQNSVSVISMVGETLEYVVGRGYVTDVCHDFDRLEQAEYRFGSPVLDAK